ncbi:putative RNA-directed DNA polymerase [Tanacetum coccineum]|uniref:RNA-directed DNA polymerase n=1 Tax=Tanacetum coccineum TaxID=301880 RepID=A0ABQ5GHB2_9ASTR
MHGDETLDAYLNCAQEYADALAAIGEPVKDKDLVMLVVSGLCEEYNGLKTIIIARQSPTAFSELHALLSDHDYMLGKTRTPIGPYGPQAFYGARPSNNNRSNNNNNCGNRNNSRGNNNRGRDNGRQFDWASTQNTVYGTCNRCDTGANSHVIPDLEAMDNSEAYYGDEALHVGNGKGLPILHIGSYKVYSPQKTFSLKNILHVPEISHNLLSVQIFCHDKNVFFEFHTSYFVVKDESTLTTLLTGPSKHGLYTITLPQLKSINKVSLSVVQASPTIWHRRIGHLHQPILHYMLSNFSLPVTNKSLSSFCNSCPLGKSSKLPLFESGFRSNNILDLVYCDVWGPAPLLSFEGHRYFMLCVDHHSRYMWIYHLAQKSDVYSTFKSFVQMVERQFTTKLKNVQTDWGGEFRNLASFFSSLGIIHRRSCPHTSEQNGFVERRNRHVVETGLTLLAQACVPQRFWHYAFDTAVYLINRMPSRTSTNKSPFEHIFKRSPDYSFLRVFGCLCFPHLRPYNRHKMDFRSTPCVFLGYSPSHHGYRCLDISTERLYITRHVRFNEAQFPFDIPKTTSAPPSKTSPYYSSESPYVIPTTDHPSPSSPRSPISSPSSVSHLSRTSQTFPESSNGQPSPVSTTSIPTPPPPTLPPPPPITRKHPANLRQNPKQRVPYNPSANHATVLPTTITEPTSFTVANKSPKWRQAMKEELKRDKNVLSLVTKQDLLQKGFSNNQEPVYMKQPSGFIDPQRPNHVCLLYKSLYGLKQAPGAWFQRLSKALFDLDFKGSKMDPSLFIYSRGHTLLYILVYVDDIIVTGNNKGTIDNIISQLGSAFALKDLGPLNYFFGIEIVPHVSGILLSQKKYILELLQSDGVFNCNPVPSPMVTSSSLSLNDNTAFSNPVKYRQVVGSLQYATLSRPNIAFAVNKVCQYMHAPTENHWSAVKQILRYLHGTVEHGMLICRSSGSTLQAFTNVLWKGNPDTSLEAFLNTDLAGDSDDRRSTGGFAIYLGSNLISWTTRKQRTVSRSSTEAKYKALADIVAELTWLQALLHELGIRSFSTPILWCDNLGATYLSATLSSVRVQNTWK